MKETYLFTNNESTFRGLRFLKNHRLLKDFSDFSGISYGRVWSVSNDIDQLSRMSMKNVNKLVEKLEEYFELILLFTKEKGKGD